MSNLSLFILVSNAQKQASGLSTYTTFVLRNLLESGQSFDIFIDNNAELKEDFKRLINDKVRLISFDSLSDLKKHIIKTKYKKVFFSSPRDTYIDLPSEIIPIVVIHDLRFRELANDQYRFIYRKTAFARFKQRVISILKPDHDAEIERKLIDRFIYHPSLKVVTVSHHSKNSILLNYPHLEDDQVEVLYCPYPLYSDKKLVNENSLDLLDRHNLKPRDYFLILSANRWTKNSYRVLSAFDDLAGKAKLRDKKVLVLGLSPNDYLAKQFKNKEVFVFEKYAEDEQLQQLFKNAYCFLYPSLQEGFGIPPLEAMKFGTPVLASPVSAIYEVCKEGAYYFNPFSKMEIANRILYILGDESFYQETKENAIKRSQKISQCQLNDMEKLKNLILN